LGIEWLAASASLALRAAAINCSASAGATSANVLGDFVSVFDFVEARTGAVHINAAISGLHSAITTRLGEMVALPLTDLCNASVVDCSSAGAIACADTDFVLALNSLVAFHSYCPFWFVGTPTPGDCD
jgi:hypothetical protein